MNMFEQRATRGTRKGRIALIGPSGSGKTKTGLLLAEGLLQPGQKIALLDTEHRSSELYADEHEFYPAYMAAPYSPQRYTKVIQEAAARGDIGVLLIDSLSHAWMGSGGVLEQVDHLAGSKNDNRNAWKQMTPVQQQLVETIIGAPFHVIATLRTKDAYALNEKNQRVKAGLAPVQREGLDYEFDVVLYLNQEHQATVDKSRVSQILPVGAVIDLPGPDASRSLGEWLASGQPRGEAETPTDAPAAAAPPPSPPAAPAPQQAAQAADPFADDPTEASSPVSAEAPAPNGETAPSATPDAAPASAAMNGADPFGDTPETPATPATDSAPAATSAGSHDDQMLIAMRMLVEQKCRQLAALTKPKDAAQDEAAWMSRVQKRSMEWYGAAYDALTADQLADLSGKLETSRVNLISKRQPAGAAS